MIFRVCIFLYLFPFLVLTSVIDYKSNCTCVPYYQCSEETGGVITNGAGLFDTRLFRNAHCTGYFDVCCNTTLTIDNDPPEKEEKPRGCGYHVPGVFPWSVILRIQKDSTKPFQHKCGASLIHSQVAITAAHCTDDVTARYEVKIGKQATVVTKIIRHPKFNINTLQNDVALLVLKNPLKISEEVSLICIPPPRFSIEHNQCITSSWNNTDDSKVDPVPRLIKLPVISKKNCENTLRATRLGTFFQLHKTFVCAGGEAEKDTCNGDGGNPLICPISGERGRYHQVGIVSWGIGCGEFNMPGVYVRLSIFRDWIDKVMLKNGFDINGYRY
ncbi:phenoloxidase-activating factor 2-like [Agrilus planipennis]|uniref:Phenoloxidase-activating factor 2-like n=1 Tax=Agrilus planipennis TaxID=224129 RepID=A0A7F5R707_AGRPL|nr:phenoloxidase-activating factor 2-like [Agrilus planipennis]